MHPVAREALKEIEDAERAASDEVNKAAEGGDGDAARDSGGGADQKAADKDDDQGAGNEEAPKDTESKGEDKDG